jgi:ABC-type dipeptide/oligopeptide/nickel transport system permease component
MGLRSRGLSEWRVAWHVFLHALPIVGSRALQRLPQLACGSVAVEAVFDVPGLGHLMLLALRTGDVALAQGLVLAMAIPLVIARTLIALGTAPASGRSDAQRPDGVTAAPAAARARESFPLEVQP